MMRSFQVADEDSANGWSRTTTAVRRRLYRPLSSPVLGVRMEQGDRPDSNRHRRDHDPGCSRYTTVTMSRIEKKRERPDSNRRPPGGQPGALAPLSYVRVIARVGFEPTVSIS